MIKDIYVEKTDDPEYDKKKQLDSFDEDKDKEYYIFTDGCGNISLELCKLINDRLGLYQCSAYQIRLGGAKGVLMVKPSLGEAVRLVELRNSNIKF